MTSGITEQWLPIQKYEGCYEISSMGRVRNVRRGRILTPMRVGYRRNRLAVTLCESGRRENKSVHRLVLETFIGPCPDGMECCHNNDIPTDNRVENLRWDTRKANMDDLVRNGGHMLANKTVCKHGHDLSPANTYIDNRGYRSCVPCRRRRAREFDRRSRAKLEREGVCR